MGAFMPTRRAFCAGASAAALVVPRVGRAQEGARPKLIAFQHANSRDPLRFELFRTGMRERGYVYGRDFVVEFFEPFDPTLDFSQFDSVVRLSPDIIVVT